jgi:hypothetical protein
MTFIIGDKESLFLSALIGDRAVLSIKGGTILSVEQNFNHYSRLYHQDLSVYHPDLFSYMDIGLKIRVFDRENYQITQFDEKLNGMPIGNKPVDECTIDELLFAIQTKMKILV